MLRDYFRSLDRFGVVPILGYAGLGKMEVTSQQCLLDPRLHADLTGNNQLHFHSDAILPLLDLTVEAECYGIKPVFKDRDAPEIRTFLPLDNLVNPEQSGTHDNRTSIMVEAARLISREARGVPTGFFITGPFTLAGQIIGVQKLMTAILQPQAAVSTLLESCTNTVVSYAKRLEDTGVNFLVMADPTSTMISPAFREIR